MTNLVCAAKRCLLSILLLMGAAGSAAAQGTDQLASWNDVQSKQAIVAFVERVTAEGATDFVPEAERVAVFDNDGTLWGEQPMYFQLLFALDRVKEMAPQHPEWKDKEPFASLLKGDLKTAFAGGEPAIMDIVMTTHSGMTSEEFDQIVATGLPLPSTPKPASYTQRWSTSRCWSC